MNESIWERMKREQQESRDRNAALAAAAERIEDGVGEIGRGLGDMVEGRSTAGGAGLSRRALDRIGRVRDAERRGVIGHDAAEAEILQIVREES